MQIKYYNEQHAQGFYHLFGLDILLKYFLCS